jgi:activator of HSP90 ATPase
LKNQTIKETFGRFELAGNAMKLKTTTITQKVSISASPDEVYDAFIDAKKHSAFTGAKATGEARVGAEITAWDGYITGKNLELEKGKRIVQEWSTSEWPKGYSPSRLELTFCKVEGGTEVTMVHSKVPAEQADEYRQGWVDNYWDLLKEYFAKKKREN